MKTCKECRGTGQITVNVYGEGHETCYATSTEKRPCPACRGRMLRHDLLVEYHYPCNGGEAVSRIELHDQAAENVYRAARKAARIESDRIDRIRKREAWYKRWPLWPYPGDVQP